MTLKVPNRAQRRASVKLDVMQSFRWLLHARLGWHIQYHIGFLGGDRREDDSVERLARLFAEAHRLGLVTLSQARAPASDQWCYLAKRTEKPIDALTDRLRLERALLRDD